MVHEKAVGLVEETREMKAFLKPTVLKAIVAIVLLIAFSWLWRLFVISTISDTFPMGFPLQFFLSWGPCRPGENCSEFNGFYLVLDLAFWYMIGAFLVGRFWKK